MDIYWDYDGVFGDTMTPAIIEMKSLGLFETEEGRTKYFKELDWEKFLVKAGFMENAPEAINLLAKKGYKQSFLTHVNSLAEAEAKIKFIKSITRLIRPGDIDIIVVPRSLDKAFTIKPNGAILIDDRLLNIKAWEENGGVGILFSNDLNNEFVTLNNPMDVANYIIKTYPLSSNEPRFPIINKEDQALVANLFKHYCKNRFDTFLIYDKLVKDDLIIDRNYNFKDNDKILDGIKNHYDLVNLRSNNFGPINNQFASGCLYFAIDVVDVISHDKYNGVKELMNTYYESNKETEEVIFTYEMKELPVYEYVKDNLNPKKVKVYRK
ncbi:MAG: hypothetical protein PHO63_00935 [Bacilli bacterium]|nr:hypothetical protein [Bacilli bacterium]MDD4808538.1 hypothetical protein [Bacilli bacterium]